MLLSTFDGFNLESRQKLLYKLYLFDDTYFVLNQCLGEMQRIAFRLMLSSCVSVCVRVCIWKK